MAVRVSPPRLFSRAFEDLRSEVTDVELPVTGQLPPDLAGTLHRVVPTAFDWPHGSLQHWFDGHGQVHAVRIADGQAAYSSRFVQTAALARSRETGRPGSSFGTRDGGILRNLGGPSGGGTANTNVVKLGDRLLALQEGSRPYAMDPHTLETLGQTDLGGLTEGLSAHPHWDPRRREAVAANLIYGKDALVRMRTLDAAGRVAGSFDFALDYNPLLVHDAGVAANHVVVPVFPQVLNVFKLLAGLSSLAESSHWDPARGTTFHVAKRDGSDRRRYELPAMYGFHVVNCFEEADTLVLDLVTTPTGAVVAEVGAIRTHGPHGLERGRVQRVRLYADGRATVDTLAEAEGFEFPRIDPRRQGVPNRHSFFVAGRGADPFASVARLDAETGELAAWQAPSGHWVGEPVPVTKAGDDRDGACWLLAVVYDPGVHRSRVVVLDGERVADGPVAELHLPNHVPLGFHGNFSRSVSGL